MMGNTVPVSNTGSLNLSNFQNTADLSQAISHDVSLHDAAVMGSDHTGAKNTKTLERLETLAFNSSLADSDTSLINGTNFLDMFASDNCCRNLTNQDFFLGLDGNGLDEINLTSLAMEENFDPAKISSLFNEPDSDSGLLDLDCSNSSLFTCDSDTESSTSDDLEAVGGCCLEYSCMDYQDNYGFTTELHIDVFHDHTYSQITHQLASSVSQHYLSWLKKSTKVSSRKAHGIERSQISDEYRAKALKIPFSVSDIVTLPVGPFNSLLANYYLTDNQLALIRDIRRRGKNKVAAQNCRKRKLDAIMNLKDDVCHLQAQKERLKKEKAQCNQSINNIKQKLNDLCWDIFSGLKDDQGRHVNPNQCTMHCSSNGTVLIIPGRGIKLEHKQDTKTRLMT
ncbi:nuclear factor erythroid 2-related factor 3 [Varanus komodoensis]|uniref:nuclear factor erythroid 2-related factor 3 n=1 Tax=Varanus komodoensis TaxID=61221 RepID=UPI001CF77DB4|nr:nuclear factor erythroid 2-related factor 3 [Varanus komodoensis]